MATFRSISQFSEVSGSLIWKLQGSVNKAVLCNSEEHRAQKKKKKKNAAKLTILVTAPRPAKTPAENHTLQVKNGLMTYIHSPKRNFQIQMIFAYTLHDVRKRYASNLANFSHQSAATNGCRAADEIRSYRLHCTPRTNHFNFLGVKIMK